MTEMPEVRPVWHWQSVSEDDARWLLAGTITAIAHKWAFVKEDEVRWWVVVTRCDGTTRELAGSKFSLVNQLFRMAVTSTGLEMIEPYVAARMRETIAAIDAWERQNVADRAEYERLRRKFGSGAA